MLNLFYKQFHFILCLTFVPLLLARPTYAFSCPEDGADCRCDFDGKDLVSFQVQVNKDNTPFNMVLPRAYLGKRARQKNGGTYDGASLFIKADTFEPWPHNIKATIRNGPLLDVVISQLKPLEKIAQFRANRAALTPGDELKKFPEIQSQYGLLKLDYTIKAISIAGREVFLSRDDQNILKDVIACRPPETRPGRRALCSHFIDMPLADLIMSYSRDLLPHWQDISRKVQSLMNCATSYNLK